MIGKNEIAAKLADELGIAKNTAKAAVDGVVDAVTEALQDGDAVRLPGLGTFVVKDTAARKGRNPVTGETVDIAAGKKVTFKAATDLKGKL
jgi:DNA-binding protein HU-beta